jgi:hypothetical protein
MADGKKVGRGGFQDVTGFFQGWGEANRSFQSSDQGRVATVLYRRSSDLNEGLQEAITQLETINHNHVYCWLNKWLCEEPSYPKDTLSLRLKYRSLNSCNRYGLFVPLMPIMEDDIFKVITEQEKFRSLFGWGRERTRTRQSFLSDFNGYSAGEISSDTISKFLKGPRVSQILKELEVRFRYPLGLLEVDKDFLLSWELASDVLGKDGVHCEGRPVYLLCAIVASWLQ